MNESLPPAIKLRVFTLSKILVDIEVQEVTLPSLDGYLGILPGHRPLVTILGEGSLTYSRQGRQEQFSVDGGYAEINSDTVLVFTELAEDETNGTAQS